MLERAGCEAVPRCTIGTRAYRKGSILPRMIVKEAAGFMERVASSVIFSRAPERYATRINNIQLGDRFILQAGNRTPPLPFPDRA